MPQRNQMWQAISAKASPRARIAFSGWTRLLPQPRALNAITCSPGLICRKSWASLIPRRSTRSPTWYWSSGTSILASLIVHPRSTGRRSLKRKYTSRRGKSPSREDFTRSRIAGLTSTTMTSSNSRQHLMAAVTREAFEKLASEQ